MSVDAVLANAGVRFAYLFGSRATGSARPDSDADVAVMCDEALDLRDVAALAADLAVPLNVPSVDVVDLLRAPLELRGKVVVDGRLIFDASPPRRVRFEVETRSMWFDYRPTLEAHTRRFLRQVAEGGIRGR